MEKQYPDYRHRVQTTIGRLCQIYGVPFSDANVADLSEGVALYRDEKGIWHLTGEFDDEQWAPKDDAQADEVLRALEG